MPPKKYEIIRRVTAENMAQGNYILCDLGCVPNSTEAVEISERLLSDNERIGMIQFSPEGSVSVCRKGIIEKWPKMETLNYHREHAHAYITEGYTVQKCLTLQYHRLGVH